MSKTRRVHHIRQACEDYPCCGHEWNDCQGQLYGTDQAIMDHHYARLNHPSYDPYYDREDY